MASRVTGDTSGEHGNGHNRRNHAQGQVVLLTLDGSEAAATALPAARAIAWQLSMPLRLLHVVPSPISMADIAERLHVDGIVTAEQIVVRVGDPVDEILNAIEDRQTYLTVMTTHGRYIEPGRHLGHIAEAVVASTLRPILLIRPEAATTATEVLSARRFLLPLDGSATTARSLSAITDIVARLNGSFDVLFVVDPSRPTPRPEEPGGLNVPSYVDQPQHEWPSWMREVLDYLCACSSRYPLGISTRVHVRQGAIDTTLLQFVEDHENDAIVLVRSSHLEPGHASVLRAVLDHTPCPVVLTGAIRRHGVKSNGGHRRSVPSPI